MLLIDFLEMNTFLLFLFSRVPEHSSHLCILKYFDSLSFAEYDPLSYCFENLFSTPSHFSSLMT